MARTSWSQKLDKPPAPVVKPLDRRFAGHHSGDLMLISTPRAIKARIRRLRPGTALTIAEFRDRLPDAEMRVVALYRQDTQVDALPETRILPGDEVFVLADTRKITAVFGQFITRMRRSEG